ncbi:MAG: rRNA maturation RNase YbeY [Patescibacteria group bacterium]|nr:rRNA maturation RNase YbeY [Patescibacteria group bacterium]
MALDIRNTTRGPLPRVPFAAIAEDILGSRYELSLVVCSDALAQRMNIEYRQKTYKPNVLSFPITAGEGEIFLNVACARREAARASLRPLDRIAHLFVHGCLHLKGLPHGSKMDSFEKKYLLKYGFAEPQ